MSQVEHLPTTESNRRAILPLLAWPRLVALAFGMTALAYATPLFAETRCAGDAGPGKPKLTVQVDGVRNLQGQAAITIYPDDRRRFMARGGKLLRTRVPVSSLKIRACFWLPKGTYAVVVYHDEDGDGGFDRTALGLPKEGYGFSNDAPARSGLPSFESVRFKHEGASSLSMLAHNPATRDMPMETYQGNVVLLIVGGNDTTRNTISGSVVALNKNPDQYAKLRANPDLILPMISETIRWQTPLAHMSRVATRDVEVGGKTIKKGERVVMWYISGNRDEEMIENPNAFIIDRERPRQHMSFGFGIHRCVGNRVAEMQLTIIWEEILKRFPEIKVVGDPVLNWSAFVHGYESLPVVIPYRN